MLIFVWKTINKQNKRLPRDQKVSGKTCIVIVLQHMEVMSYMHANHDII